MKTTKMGTQHIKTNWHLLDAKDQVLGRIATKVAHLVRGKHKPDYAPGLDCGDYVVVINADKVQVSGNKSMNKQYYRHSEYPGGLRVTNFEKLLVEHPTRVFELAVKGMLPRGPLGYRCFGKMKVYAGSEHPHQAQQPQDYSKASDS